MKCGKSGKLRRLLGERFFFCFCFFISMVFARVVIYLPKIEIYGDRLVVADR